MLDMIIVCSALFGLVALQWPPKDDVQKRPHDIGHR